MKPSTPRACPTRMVGVHNEPFRIWAAAVSGYIVGDLYVMNLHRIYSNTTHLYIMVCRYMITGQYSYNYMIYAGIFISGLNVLYGNAQVYDMYTCIPGLNRHRVVHLPGMQDCSSSTPWSKYITRTWPGSHDIYED